MLHIAICDDSASQVSSIELLVEQTLSDTEHMLFPFSSGEELLTAFHHSSAVLDIAILDVDYGEHRLDGIELAKHLLLLCPTCQIIFLTGYANYISATYAVGHVCYILKNEATFWLPKAISEAISRLGELRYTAVSIQRNGVCLLIPAETIRLCERDKRVTLVSTTQGVRPCSDRLECLLAQMPSAFVQCHKSFLVNFRFVRQYRRTEFLMDDDRIIPISRGFSSSVQDLFHQSFGLLR